MNTLYYGDNLGVLREHVKDDSVDLVYLDPPFNSNQDYNVLFAERDGSRAAKERFQPGCQSLRLVRTSLTRRGRNNVRVAIRR